MNTRERQLKPGEIIPINFDYVFNNIFNNKDNIDILENFLAIYFDRPIEDIRGHIKLNIRELSNENKKEMDNQVDINLELDGKIINIELNNNGSQDILERNIVYLCKIHGKQLKYGEKDYSKIGYSYQINLNNFRCNEKDIKEEYYLKSKSGRILSEKIKIDLVDIAIASDKRYNKYNERLARFLRAIVSIKKEELEKELGDIMESEAKEKLVNQVEEYSNDEEVVTLYSKYTRQELERNTLIHDALVKGRNEGIEEGSLNKSIEIAKNLLNNNISIDIISDSTGLSIEEIEKLK